MDTTVQNHGASHRLADLPARIAFALPAIAVAVALVVVGGGVFAAGVAAIGAFAMTEACRMTAVPPRVAAATIVGLVALAAGALAEGREALVPALAATIALLGVAAAAEPPGRRLTALAPAALAVVWVGFGVAHAILLRELPHGGGLLVDVLFAVFIGDTAAHLIGSVYGRRKLAPTISPNKTIEGLVAGVITATAVTIAIAALFQPWLELGEAAAIGLAAAIAAPAGDLFESMVKRDAGVKDSGQLLGPHGGVLDRVDAVLFAVVACYYVAVALL